MNISIIKGNHQKRHFEKSAVWHRTSLEVPKEKARIEETIESIPPDVQSILDVGCGNGLFVNTLMSTYSDRFNRIIGMDRSREVLKYVETEKIEGCITNLCFEDKKFDLVACLEVLEHLTEEDFKKGISELRRVSKKYIIVTVPNDQNLLNSLVMCVKCYCRFNPCYHVRSFNKNILQNLFENFRLIEVKEIGPSIKKRQYNHLITSLYQSWKKPALSQGTICPQCGYEQPERPQISDCTKRTNIFSLLILSLLKPFARLVSPVKQKKRWLLALYEKTNL